MLESKCKGDRDVIETVLDHYDGISDSLKARLKKPPLNRFMQISRSVLPDVEIAVFEVGKSTPENFFKQKSINNYVRLDKTKVSSKTTLAKALQKLHLYL